MSIKEKSKKNRNQLSFTQKCIIISNIQYEKDKAILNSFDLIPLVKLYTSTMRQEVFNYTKVKGGLFLLQDKGKETKNFYIRIYDSKDYSLRFNLEINPETKKNYIKLQPKFYCFNLKIGCIGFLFQTEDEAENFKKIFDKEESKTTMEEYEQINFFSIKGNDKIYINEIKSLKDDLTEKYAIITYDRLYPNYNQITDYLIFSGFLDLIKLIFNTEFDYEDNVFNIFVDKNYPLKSFKKLFKYYNTYNLYPIRPIFNDYLNIYNKSNYVDFLVNHLINNFKEQSFIYRNRKEFLLNQKKKMANSGRQSNNSSANIDRVNSYQGDSETKKTGTIGENTTIEEDPQEYSMEAESGNTIGKFFSGLNPFK